MSAGQSSTQSPNGSPENDPKGSATDVRLHSMAVMFTDMAGSTEYAESHGTLAAVEKRRKHDDLLCPLVDKHGGTLVNVIGDALLAVFDDAVAATQCAVQMQNQLTDQRKSCDEDRAIHVRIGIHFGETALWHGRGRMEVGGRAVNVASRVESGFGRKTDEILLSNDARARLDGCDRFRTESVGTVEAHGVGELELHRVLWQEAPRCTDRLPSDPAQRSGRRRHRQHDDMPGIEWLAQYAGASNSRTHWPERVLQEFSRSPRRNGRSPKVATDRASPYVQSDDRGRQRPPPRD